MQFKTAAGMMQYCRDYIRDAGAMTATLEENFQVLHNALQTGEDVIVPFTIERPESGILKQDLSQACAVTTDRILLARKKTLGRSIHVIPWKLVEEVTITEDTSGYDLVNIATIKEDLTIPLATGEAVRVYDRLAATLKQKRRSALISRILTITIIVLVLIAVLFVTYKMGLLPFGKG